MTRSATDTRARILETAWELVRLRGINDVTVADVARGAGVSRQLVYFHFGNRAGLLTAMTRHHDSASGFIGRVVATRSLPPAQALEGLLREWLAYLPQILPLARALEAAAIRGEEGAQAWYDRWDDLREAYRIAVDRVARDGGLAEGWTSEPATDWLWVHTHPAVYQHLVLGRGWDPDHVVDRTVRSILDQILRRKPPAH